MAALTIENATVGYDSDKVATLMSDIRANVIDSASQAMTDSLEALNTAVDQAWAGHSAKVFKENMQKDVDTVKKALDDTYTVLHNEIIQIVKAMHQVDQELIQRR